MPIWRNTGEKEIREQAKRVAVRAAGGLLGIIVLWTCIVSGSRAAPKATASLSGPAQANGCSNPDWYAVDVPQLTGSPDDRILLTDVAGVSSSDLWAGGFSYKVASGKSVSGSQRPLLLHWNGTAWSVASDPVAGSNALLSTFATISASDVWVVGTIVNNGVSQGLTLHWNGSEWAVVPSPNPGSTRNYISGITALSANDIWAVGSYWNDAGRSQPDSMHWDGTRWNMVPVPDPPYSPNPYHQATIYNGLGSVAAVAPNDVWAVGAYTASYTSIYTLIEHWDGRHWSIVPGPNPSDVSGGPGPQNHLMEITAIAPNDVWALGYYVEFRDPGVWSQYYDLALIAHWNGSSWSALSGPNVEYMSALSSTDIWASGQDGIQHWNGSTWSRVPTPHVTRQMSGIGQIRAISQDDASAIVYTQSSSAFILHYTCNAPPTPSPTTTTTPIPAPSPTVVPSLPGEGSLTFAQTGQTVKGVFLDYWQTHGGLAQQGYPISGLISEVSELDHKTYTVQYFERAVFEYHPENAPPYNVLLSQLGTYRYKSKYPAPGGAASQQPNTSGRSVLFSETSHRLGGRFLEYWQTHGGLAQQGYPISDEFVEKSQTDGNEYLVQYFERSVMELHPENQAPNDVLLSLLGAFEYADKYGVRQP